MMLNLEERLNNALNYPRWLIEQDISKQTCPHQGYFDQKDFNCLVCEHGLECEWLNTHEEKRPSMGATTKEKRRTLLDALGFAYAHIAKLKHDTDSCECETCTWIRNTEELVDELK